MRRLRKAAAAVCVLSMMGVGAWALAEGQAKDDRSATTELMQAIVPPAAYDAILEQMYKQMSATIQQMGGNPIPESKQQALKEAVRECMPYADLIKWSTDVYLKYFTRQEIDDLAAFYRTPTGKKIAAKLPQVTSEVGALIAPMFMSRMPPALKKHGISI